jgi:APA family basic amino acid/polyamine antiporter
MSLSRLWRRKPLAVFQQEWANHELRPEFGLLSLVLFGIGATVGSGVFVLSGQIAAQNAGPATALSWLVASVVCLITALAYAEFATLLKSPGSAYSFCYYGLGELCAVTAAYLVTLECGMSGAAVSRTWGDKLAYWIEANGWGCLDKTESCWINSVGGTTFNPAATLISSLMVAMILMGVKVSKVAINISVAIKVALVLFVIVCGSVYVTPSNLTPFVPPANTAQDGAPLPGFTGGFSGIMVGATSAFFGYIGFDEICCMVAETKNPVRNTPLGVLLTILSITALYVAASVVLTGMVPYNTIDPNEGFGSAFVAVGAPWAMQITVIGELLIVLPTVILVSYMPQSRIVYAVSKDGHLPRLFSRVSASGNLFWGSLVCGVLFTLVAAFVPFANLNDLISAGILLSFILTNTALLLTRSKQKAGVPVVALVLGLGVLAAALNKLDLAGTAGIAVSVLSGLVALGGLAALLRYDLSTDAETFKVPFVPFVPAVAVFVNWYLFWQLSWLGLGLVLALVAFAALTYFAYGFRNAKDFSALPVDNIVSSNRKLPSVILIQTPAESTSTVQPDALV